MKGAPRRTPGWMRQPADRARRLHARAPLRVRLVAALVALVAIALVGSGFAAVTIMQSYLVGRLDSQLTTAAGNAADSVARGDYEDGLTGGGGRGRGSDHHSLPSAYVLEVLAADGSSVYGPSHDLIDENEPLPRLPVVTGADAKADGTQLRTVPAVRGGESWRLLVEPVTLEDGTTGVLLIAQSLGDVQGTVDRLVLVMAIIGGLAVVVLAGVGYVVVRASLRPLRDVERTAAAIAGGDLSRRVPHSDERTEVGSLAGSLNTMLAEIEGAFSARAASEQAARVSETRMRQFVADASHELRTPLTTIRGFAELYRQRGAVEPAAVARYMERIEGEAARMGVLVEDLLLLARLDQQRPLRREPVDLLALVSDAVQDTRATSPDRPVRLEIGNADPPPVVVGDEARLRQVLANLLANAVQHTAPATPVWVHLESVVDGPGSGCAHLVVADQGGGMTAEQAAHAFERFYRADSARSREDGGAGLGLAIVAALVAGHAGTVRVETELGRGTRFHVDLPLAPVTPS